MSDELSNATRIAALEDYNQRLLSENVRLTNEAAFMRSFINNEDVRSDFQTVTQMRQALDRERERCGVLERECRKFRERYIEKCEFDAGTISHTIWYSALAKELETSMEETDTSHALDAAKFVGGG